MVLNQFTCWRKRTHTANFEYSVVKKLVIAQPTSKYFRWPSKRSQHGQPRSFVQASVCAGLGAFVSVDVSEAGDGFLDGMRAHLVCCTWLYGSSRKCVFFCVFVLVFFVLCFVFYKLKARPSDWDWISCSTCFIAGVRKPTAGSPRCACTERCKDWQAKWGKEVVYSLSRTPGFPPPAVV